MIRIEQLNFAVGSFALREVSLHVGPGEYFVLLGPTGSGKTLLVECLCGLTRIDSGRIYIGGNDVTRLEPRRRGVGYLPQDYALFPHQTVRRNIRFGLNNRHLTLASIRQRVDQLLEQLGLVHLADRLPGKLSGGEQQRVALARALAIRPQVLLLDEPVSALDEQTRDSLCRLLKQLQKTTQTTTLHVCHNFVEMLAVADRVGIIEQGRILQVGAPQEVLQRPNSGRVARFVQAGNLFSARARFDGEWVRLACAGGIEFSAPRSEVACPPLEATRSGPGPLPLPTDLRSVSGAREVDVLAMVRPENIHLRPAGAATEDLPPGTTVLEGSILEVVDLGPVVKVSLACGTGAELLVLLGKKEYNQWSPIGGTSSMSPRWAGVGQRVQLSVRPQDVHVIPQ